MIPKRARMGHATTNVYRDSLSGPCNLKYITARRCAVAVIKRLLVYDRGLYRHFTNAVLTRLSPSPSSASSIGPGYRVHIDKLNSETRPKTAMNDKKPCESLRNQNNLSEH